MGKLGIFAIFLCSITMVVPLVFGVAEGPKEVEEWFHSVSNHHHPNQKVTKMHFYLHDVFGVTTKKVAKPNTTAKSPTFFGETFMIDNPLTVGPSQASKLIGRAQGLYGFSSMEEVRVTVAMNLVFTDGSYNGSSLTSLGHNPVLQPKCEMPIIGGSGIFRLARGVALLNTYSHDDIKGNTTVEYNVILQHY
ncbi:Dirigent protein [Actinidia chinensis var. chinensis]|uniref:Dirigent protein n=1 Tax=Actinidia chinensis var. chinensis TaxID=1590841 RepID=A0A2R6R6T6_ACTCC|nr:Dirigent protein [Actinidia chinensis var. chinensis]